MPLRHVRNVLDALRARNADDRLLRRLEAVAENRCRDPATCRHCTVRCVDAAERPAAVPPHDGP